MKKEENSKDERRRDDEITPEGVPRLEQTVRCCKIKKLINFPRILLRGLVHSGRHRYAIVQRTYRIYQNAMLKCWISDGNPLF